MTNSTTFTQADMFTAIKSVFEGGELAENMTAEDVVNFCDERLERLAVRAEKSRAYAAKRKADGGVLADAVYAALTSEPQTIDDITASLSEDLQATRAKVTNRLTTLVKDGKAVKSEVMIENGEGKNRKVAAYALA